MFFNKRRRYNGAVATLLPAFGFTLDEAGTMKTLNVLDTAWQQKYNENEAALFVAYLFFHGVLKVDRARADEILARIKFVEGDWSRKGIVRKELASRFSAKANEWLAESTSRAEVSDASPPSMVFMASLPKPDVNKPLARDQSAGMDVLYYENPITIGAAACIPDAFSYPQLAVASLSTLPIAIIRIEKSALGSAMLCALDPQGSHFNYGPVQTMARSQFVAQAIAIAEEIRSQSGN
jgi:hypothetical protein